MVTIARVSLILQIVQLPLQVASPVLPMSAWVIVIGPTLTRAPKAGSPPLIIALTTFPSLCRATRVPRVIRLVVRVVSVVTRSIVIRGR